jgi:hypothetical protein
MKKRMTMMVMMVMMRSSMGRGMPLRPREQMRVRTEMRSLVTP